MYGVGYPRQVATAPSGAWASSLSRLHDHTHTTLDRNPLDGWSARRRDLCLPTQNSLKRQASMPSAGFEPTIPANKRPQIHALDRAVTGIGVFIILMWL
jgi:hypothetical protein